MRSHIISRFTINILSLPPLWTRQFLKSQTILQYPRLPPCLCPTLSCHSKCHLPSRCCDYVDFWSQSFHWLRMCFRAQGTVYSHGGAFLFREHGLWDDTFITCNFLTRQSSGKQQRQPKDALHFEKEGVRRIISK